MFSAPRPRIRGLGPRAGAEGARLYVYFKFQVGGSANSKKSGQYSLRLNTEEITECIMKKLSEIGRASRASEVRSVLRTKEQDGTYLDPRELSGVQPKEPNQLMRINKPRGRRAVGRSPIEVPQSPMEN